MSKIKIEVSLEVVVDETVSKEDISNALEKALEPLKCKVDSFSDVVVRTVSHADGGPIGTGYASRLWSKATCQ